MNPFDLAAPAPNGLRRGLTTGTCATAAVKAALVRLLYGETCEEVRVTLPEGETFVTVPIHSVENVEEGARAAVVKDGGDDPDQTHRATLTATVRRNRSGSLRFLAGPGVGTVTQAGLRVPVGEPAINPTPRLMIRRAVLEVQSENEDGGNDGFDLEIGCVNGEEIAKRTFNPRLGIVGGISILGTTGIVEPKSLASFKASIEVYVNVALADGADAVVLSPGNIGQRFARHSLALPLKRIVQMSNFVGFALDCVERRLAEEDRLLDRLWIVGHPGKLAKLLNAVWDTHSSASESAVAAVAAVAADLGWDPALRDVLSRSLTVEGQIETLGADPRAGAFWQEIERRVEAAVAGKLTRVKETTVRLFKMDGTPLGVSP